MGYSTYHTLKWDKPQPDEKLAEARKRLGDMADEFVRDVTEDKIVAYIEAHEDILYAVGEDGESGERCKWYDHETDMREMSRQFPGVLFTLEGEGEEMPDLWRQFYRDGLMHGDQAQIIYPEFDESKLA